MPAERQGPPERASSLDSTEMICTSVALRSTRLGVGFTIVILLVFFLRLEGASKRGRDGGGIVCSYRGGKSTQGEQNTGGCGPIEPGNLFSHHNQDAVRL